MGRLAGLIALIIVLVVIGIFALVFTQDPEARAERRQKRRKARLDVAMDTERLASARATYLMLEQAIRLHQRVLDFDAQFPALSGALREEVLALVTKFNQRQLSEGDT